MKTSHLVIVAVVLAVLLGGWWFLFGSPAPSPSGAMGTNGSPNQGNMGGQNTGKVQQPGDGTGPKENLTLGVDSKASLGQYLIAYNGMTVYTFSKDGAASSTCYGDCAKKWPPYVVQAGTPLNLQAGVSGAPNLLTRVDGTVQVTYKGMPLYFYANDKKSGDTTGQGVGGVWFVAKP